VFTIATILLIGILVIAIDVAWSSWIGNTAVYQSVRDSLSRFSSGWRIRLTLLNKDPCPECLSTNIRRSHRYCFEKPVSIFGLWPYRCSDCNARFWKSLGRHFVQRTSLSKRQNSTVSHSIVARPRFWYLRFLVARQHPPKQKALLSFTFIFVGPLIAP